MNSFDAWYMAQHEPMRIALLGAVVALWTSVTAGIMALIVARVQAEMARRAIAVQERSIFLGLIDRRARWFDEAMALWSAWIDEQEQHISKMSYIIALTVLKPHCEKSALAEGRRAGSSVRM